MNLRGNIPRNRRIRPPEHAEQTHPSPQATQSDQGAVRGKTKRRPRPTVSQERLRERRARRLENLKAVTGVAFVIVAALALAWGIRYQVTSSKRFALETIRVRGTMQRTPEAITKEAGLKLGRNLFEINLKAVQRRILRDPWITKVEVERKLPSQITLTVKEREAAAVVVIGHVPYLATYDGDVFKQLEPGDPSDLVVITGLTHDRVAHSRKEVQDTIRRAIALAETWKQSPGQRRYPIQEVHVDELGGLTAYVGKDATAIRMGTPPYRKKVLRAARVLTEVRRRRGNAALIFMDNQAHPDRVVVRMR